GPERSRGPGRSHDFMSTPPVGPPAVARKWLPPEPVGPLSAAWGTGEVPTGPGNRFPGREQQRGKGMKAFIASNHEPTTVKVRQLLLGEGQDCPAGHVVTLDLAAIQLSHLQPAPDLLIVVLSPDTPRALTVLTALRPLTQARVLVVGPASDPKIMLQALRAGASDYIDEAELQTDLPAALKRLRTEMVGQAETGRTVAVFAPSGGSGSSTLAVNVATVLAQEHKTALLFDMKLERGDLAPLLDLRPTHTLADLCQNAAHMDRSMFESSLARHKSG